MISDRDRPDHDQPGQITISDTDIPIMVRESTNETKTYHWLRTSGRHAHRHHASTGEEVRGRGPPHWEKRIWAASGGHHVGGVGAGRRVRGTQGTRGAMRRERNKSGMLVHCDAKQRK